MISDLVHSYPPYGHKLIENSSLPSLSHAAMYTAADFAHKLGSWEASWLAIRWRRLTHAKDVPGSLI